jgi:type II secretory pathway pseudopilin PulG
MTLPTGNRPAAKAAAAAGAFTLIELILVMTLLVAVAAMTVPSLSNFFRGRTLDSEARRFLSLTRYAQSRAVSEGVPMTLWIDEEQRQYGLQIEAGFAEGDEKAVRYDLDGKLQVEVTLPDVLPAPAGGTGAGGATSARAPMAALQGAVRTPMIRFLPDGSIAGTSLQRVMFSEPELGSSVQIAPGRSRLYYEIQTNNVSNAQP